MWAGPGTQLIRESGLASGTTMTPGKINRGLTGDRHGGQARLTDTFIEREEYCV